jgi:predicted DNA-binding protein
MTDYSDNKAGFFEKHGSVTNEPDMDGKHAPSIVEKFVIRLPQGLRSKIKHLSEQNRRSMNYEIIMVLEKHIQQNLDDHNSVLSEALANAGRQLGEPVQEPVISDNELTRRLEQLPEEKKLALLELLG